MSNLMTILCIYVSTLNVIINGHTINTSPTVSPKTLLEDSSRNEAAMHSTVEPNAEQTLLDLENNMKNILNNISIQLLPHVLSTGMPSNISFSCLLSLGKIYFGIKNLETWAFKMVDSSAKLSGGLLEGTASDLGDYDECLDVVMGEKPHPKLPKGAYCLLEIKPPEPVITAVKEYQINKGKGNISLATSKSFFGFLKGVRTNPDHIMFRMGVCMPSKCDKFEIQNIVDMAARKVNMEVNVVRCEIKMDHKYQVYEIVIMVFLCNVVALTLVGTLLHIYLHHRGLESETCTLEPGPDVVKFKNRWRMSRIFEILASFSLSSSIQNLLDCSEEGDALDPIRGIKVFTVVSAIYAHTYALPHRLHLYRFRSTFNLTKFIDEFLFGLVANSSVGVDTVFLLAGFLFVYYRWRQLKKPLVLKYLLKFIIVNYIRMLAAQILVIFIFFLFPIFGSGPLWNEFVVEPLQNCAKSWWMNVLFIQNFQGPYESCLCHAWVLSTIMQLFILTSIVVWIMHRKPIFGIAVNVVLIVAAALAVAIVTALEDFPATFTLYFYDYRSALKYWKHVYVQTYNHIGPFCIGMLLAYFISEYPSPISRKRIVLSLWVASVLTCWAIIFGLFHYREEQNMNRVLAVIYATFHRPAWAISIGWVIYACSTGNGGFVNSILSWKALIPVERLCYLAYLLHIPLMYYHGGSQRERMFLGHYNQLMCFISYTVSSFLFAFIAYLFFQGPYQTMERHIFGLRKYNIWESECGSDSSESLENKASDGTENGEESSKVLYSRYIQDGVDKS